MMSWLSPTLIAGYAGFGAMPTISVKSGKKCQMIDTAPRVAELVPSGMESGLCHVFAMHTTAGITMDENADPDVADDILSRLEELAPHATSPFFVRKTG